MFIRVNWNQCNWDMIRAHQIMASQPDGCQFEDMKGYYNDYSDVASAESAMRQKGVEKYKYCKHCWDDIVAELTS